MTSAPSKSPFKTIVSSTKVILSLSLVWYCFKSVDNVAIYELLKNAQGEYIGAACFLMILEILVGAYRFKLMLDVSYHLPFQEHARQYFGATFFSMVLPGSIGGDALRVYWLSTLGVSKAGVLCLILLERYIGLIALITVALLAISLSEMPGYITSIVFYIFGLTIISILALACAYRWLDSTRRLVRASVSWLSLIKPLVNKPQALSKVFLASLIYQYATVGITFLIAKAFNIDVSVGQILALVPLVWIATLIPVSFGGLGLREVAFIYLFGFVSIPEAQALMMALGTYAVLLFGGGVGGMTILLTRRATAKH